VKKLFVGNLPFSANETDVQNFFADQAITVNSVAVMRDRFHQPGEGVRVRRDRRRQRGGARH
jgi:RNA recognition motif-containing protein